MFWKGYKAIGQWYIPLAWLGGSISKTYQRDQKSKKIREMTAPPLITQMKYFAIGIIYKVFADDKNVNNNSNNNFKGNK